ncbi:MAG: hypothetical protein U0031_04435 [Thermomicrobiales bacterium]
MSDFDPRSSISPFYDRPATCLARMPSLFWLARRSFLMALQSLGLRGAYPEHFAPPRWNPVIVGVIAEKRSKLIGVAELHPKRHVVDIHVNVDGISQLDRARYHAESEADIQCVEIAVELELHVVVPDSTTATTRPVLLSSWTFVVCDQERERRKRRTL